MKKSHLRGTTSRRSIHWSEPTLFWTVQLYVPEYSELAFFTDITGEVISMEEGGGEQICFYRLYYSQYLIKLINLTKFDKAVKRQTMLAQIDCQRQMHMSRFMQSACRPYKQAYSYHDPSAAASAKARWLVHCIAVILSDAWLHLAKL